jgi:hypothetical protein
VKGALLRIACDEQAHAELAFRFMRWALTEASPNERDELARAAERELAAFERDALARSPAASDSALESHGVLGGAMLRAVHLGAVREVARPLLSALLPATADCRS